MNGKVRKQAGGAAKGQRLNRFQKKKARHEERGGIENGKRVKTGEKDEWEADSEIK